MLEISRQGDAARNVDAKPPDSAHVRMVSTFLIEVYPPSASDALVAGIKGLRWDKDSTGSRESLTEWIAAARQRSVGGSWINLGVINAPKRKGPLGGTARSAPLPAEADYALAYIHVLTPALTCLVIQFIWDDHTAAGVHEIVRSDRETLLERSGRGYSIRDPYFRKRSEIEEARATLRVAGGDWVKQHLPGAFSRGILNGELPFCDYLLFDGVVPFQPRGAGRVRWLELLDAESDWEAWATDELPGLRLSTLSRSDKPHGLALAGVVEELAHAGWTTESGRSLSGTNYYLTRELGRMLAVWGIASLLRGYEAQLARIRDALPAQPIRRINEAIARMESVQQGAFALGADLRIAASDAALFAENEKRFAYDIPDFKALDRPPGREELLWPEVSRKGLLATANRLKEREEELRDLLFVEATTHGAIASLKLQRQLRFGTWVLACLTVGLILIGLASLIVLLRPPAH